MTAQPRPACDRGSGTVLSLTVVMLAGLLLVLVVAVGQAVLARHRAQAAADLAALAAASAASTEPPSGPAGPRGGCDEAARIARDNGARLVTCRAAADVVVRTVVPIPHSLIARLGPAEGMARAGPAGP